MTTSKYDTIPLADQLNLLGDLQNPAPDLCDAVERRVMDMIRAGRFQEIADACALHQTIHGLTGVDSKIQAMGSLYAVEEIKKLPDKFTWQYPAINPIRKLHDLGELAALKPLSRFFTGFTPSGLVVGSNPKEYGREMDRIEVGSGFHAVAAEGEKALFFSQATKKSFNDVIKLYGKGMPWLHSQPLIELMHSDRAPLDNLAIWSGVFMNAQEYLLDSLGFVERIAKPLYAGEPLDKVVRDYIQSHCIDGSSKRLSYWFGNLHKDAGQVPALQRCVLKLFNEPLDVKPELFMNAAYMNMHLALSEISEAVCPGTREKTLHGLVMGQLGMTITYNGAYQLYCDLADTMIDRKSLIQGLDAPKVKSLHAKLSWEECLPRLGLRHRGKLFREELGI